MAAEAMERNRKYNRTRALTGFASQRSRARSRTWTSSECMASGAVKVSQPRELVTLRYCPL
jgi:hypothetical protein